MTIQILSNETHVNLAVVNSHGEIVGWQNQPFFTLADLYPLKVRWMLNRTALTRPDAEETLRNIRVFTGAIYLKLEEDDIKAIQDGDDHLLLAPLTVKFPDQSQDIYILDSLWSSATKSNTLSGYTADLDTPLRNIFNYAESGVRAGRAVRGGFSSGKVKDYPIAFIPQGTLLNFGFTKPMGDGEFIIRASDALALRRALVCKPFSLGQWRFSPQIASQVKHPYDKEGLVLELLPHVFTGLAKINDHSEFIAHAFHFDVQDESREKLFDLADEMLDHPDLNLSLSPDRARAVFDCVTTGRPKAIQGFVAIAGGIPQCAVFPSAQTRFAKSQLYNLVRYPVNNSRCIMPVVAIQEGIQADWLNEIEQFQGTLFGSDGVSRFMAPGQFIVVPDDTFPAGFAHVKIIACSKNIKAVSTWKSAADVKVTQAETREVLYTGYISVNQWAHKGNAVLVDPEIWLEANGDFDFDEGEAIPETEFPLTYDAFLKEWQASTSLAVAKLPKIYTFDAPTASRSRTLVDTLAGAIAVGMAANNNLVVLNADPLLWPNIADECGTDGYFYGQMLAKGYITDAYTPEATLWFSEICQCDEENARKVIRLFYVLSFFIQCGVDGFKTNLANIGGMKTIVKAISTIGKTLTKELYLSDKLIAFNPKKSPTAFRDSQHLPEFETDEPTFGVCETLMKKALEGFAWDGQMAKLDLPEYLYVGVLPDSFKYFAIGPRTAEELEAARLLRRICRDELARRSMMTPADWALFATKVWAPLLADFVQNARIILRYNRTLKDGAAVYSIAKERKFLSMTGIGWERLAHLLWFVFNDTGGKANAGSVIPLFWVPELREHLFDILLTKPGQIDLKDEFDLIVVGMDKAGIERGPSYTVDVRIERLQEQLPVVDENGKPEMLVVLRSRNYVEFSDGRYVMFPKDGPLLGGDRFTVTFRREGSRDIGHFVRAIPVVGVDLSARLKELLAMMPGS